MDLSVAVDKLTAARAAKERAWTAYIDLLAGVLANPASVGSSQNHNGYKCLSSEKANWQLCARVAHTALRGREHAKATSFVFELGQKVILAHGWEDREPPKVVFKKQVEIEIKAKKKTKKKTKKKFRKELQIWFDGIDRRPRQYHEMFIGQYCLAMMILLGWCRLEWSDHKDYECYVVLLPTESPFAKEPTTYTQFKPFEPWWKYTDEHRHKLVKTDLGATCVIDGVIRDWRPEGWHFTGQAPSSNEDRFWHPYQQMRQAGGRPTHRESPIERPIVYRAQVEPPEWVRAVHKHEAVPYRINKEMLGLMEKLQASGRLNPRQIPADKSNKAKKEAETERKLTEEFLAEARRLADQEKFYQRMHLDFRGRMYTSRSRVNYQGDDQYRCLIEFAEGVELNTEGYFALCFHAANLWELPDHLLPEDEDGDYMPMWFRKALAGVHNTKEFIRYAENPLETYDEWQVNGITGEKLDDPLLFIRACMELSDATTKKRMIRRKGFITHLPVEVDQSNSVIQHLALFYGDKDVAEMCSLVTESDFYSEIAKDWNVAGLSASQKRKVTKKIVVPRCYGSGAERIAEEELYNLPALKDWLPEGESKAKPSTQDVIEAANRVYSSEKEALNEIFEIALSEPALKALKKEAGKDGTLWKDRTVEERKGILEQLKKEKNKNKKMRWSYARIIRHMQLVGLAKEGISRVESAVPIVKTYRKEMEQVIKDWKEAEKKRKKEAEKEAEKKCKGLPQDGEMAWATMSGFEVHFRPVYTDPVQFRVPKSKEKRKGKDRIQLRASFVTKKLHQRELERGLQANLVHSVDATLAHMVVAKAEFPVIGVHDAFAAHANNVKDLRIDFAQNLIAIHRMGKPLQNFRSDVLGEPRPEGGLSWDETSKETIAILREIEGSSFLEMIG